MKSLLWNKEDWNKESLLQQKHSEVAVLQFSAFARKLQGCPKLDWVYVAFLSHFRFFSYSLT